MGGREIGIAIMVILALLIVGGMVFAWRARLRRDASLTAPIGVPEHSEVVSRHSVLYVATTAHEQPLERLAIRPLAYRARGELVVLDRGVAMSLDGSPTVYIAATRFHSASLATVAIDRVVERNGLLRLSWETDEKTVVDSYFRIADGDPQPVLTELQRLGAVPESGAAA